MGRQAGPIALATLVAAGFALALLVSQLRRQRQLIAPVLFALRSNDLRAWPSRARAPEDAHRRYTDLNPPLTITPPDTNDHERDAASA